MKIALTVWENRISPVFDVATMMLVADIKNGGVSEKHLVPFDPGSILQLVSMLNKPGVSVLICGAITQVPANILSVNNIELIPFISGNTDKILEAYAKEKRIRSAFWMPGINRHRRRRGKDFK